MQSRLIAVALYGVLGAGVIVIACLVFPSVANRSASIDSGAALPPSRPEMQFSLVRPGGAQDAPPSGFATFEAAGELERLHALLDQKDARLQQTVEALEQATAQYESLSREFDESMQIAAGLLSSELAGNPVSADPATFEVSADPADASAAPLPLSDREILQIELQEAQSQLTAARQELDDLRRRAEQELSALLSEQLALRQTASETLLRVGASAAPVLADLLESSDPQVRMWAAQLLGDIGPAAREAAPSLRLALTDRDAQVRAAAQRALDRIEGITGN